jgi:hypothetical protein
MKKMVLVSVALCAGALAFILLPSTSSAKNDKFHRSPNRIEGRYMVVLNDSAGSNPDVDVVNEASVLEAEYRGKRAELLLMLEWWLRDVWLSTMQMEDSALAVPQLKGATEQIAQRLSPTEASENLRHLERLQRQLTTNVQESLALEISLLKLRL